MSTFAPIALFVYNRINHTKKTLHALKQNELSTESELYIFSDAAKDKSAESSVTELRTYLFSISGFKKVHLCFRENNLGVDDNIINGVSEVLNEHSKVIVLEDDLVTSPWFLRFMNEALIYYENNENVIAINGYLLPTGNTFKNSFFLKGADCWGWATWSNGWSIFERDGMKLLNQIKERGLEKEFNFDNSYPYIKALEEQANGNTKEWDIRWYASAFVADKLSLYPYRSLVMNIGHDGTGVHCGHSKIYNVELAESPVSIITNVKPSKEGYKAYCDFFNNLMPKKKTKNIIYRWFDALKSSPRS